jgi:polyhydroxybutyrate depolymerase
MMKKILLKLVLCSLSFPIFAQQTSHSITSGGESRTYIKYLPSNFNQSSESLPLVIVLHGLGDTGMGMTGTGFKQIADTARFVVVFPNGKANAFGQTGWANGTLLETANTDDVQFINQLIDEIKTNNNIDLTKVYVCGMSMGGIMTYRIACELSHRIAAAASMTGTVATSVKNSCNPAVRVPFMHWHGTADATVPYSGNPLPSLELVQSSLDMWKNINACAANDSTIIALPDNNPNDGITVERIIYNNCDNNQFPLEHWKFYGGDHTWFRTPTHDVNGSTEFWKFFRQFQRIDAPPTSNKIELSNSKIDVFPNPSLKGETIKIQTSENIERIMIMSIEGKVVIDENLKNNINIYEFNLSKSGIYIVSTFGNKGNFSNKKLIIN